MADFRFAPPWLDRETGEYYGPKTMATYSKHVAQHRQWAYHKQGPEREEAPLVHRFVQAMHAEVPESEMEVYRLVYLHRLSLSESAEDSGWSRSTVRSYLKRLRVRADAWELTLDANPDVCQ